MSDDGAKRKGLGRGLAALLGDDAGEDLAALDRVRAAREVPVEELKPSPYQPRRSFDQAELDSLVQSIKARGILQPILVRRSGAETPAYEIVAGERRWRAAQAAGLHQVPVVVREFSDQDTLEIALIENIQRQDLTPIEEGEGYRRLIEDFGYNQDQLAEHVGRSRSHIANTVRLLGLPDEVKAMIDDGRLSAGAARALITAEDPLGLARQIVARGMSVRQIEKLRAAATGRRSRAAPQKDPNTRALEDNLSASLGLDVTIGYSAKRGGAMRIGFRSLEQLDDLCRRLTQDPDRPRPAAAGVEEEPLTPSEAAQAMRQVLNSLNDESPPD